jgi:hypothetical protein
MSTGSTNTMVLVDIQIPPANPILPHPGSSSVRRKPVLHGVVRRRKDGKVR